MEKKSSIEQFRKGLVLGMPVFFGYLPVSFTFGIMCCSGGMAGWLSVFTSLSNLTSAGQFAGVRLIFSGAGMFEIALTVFIINLRYMLMSLSLSQKLEKGMPLWKKLIIGYGVTDEIFAIASMGQKTLTASFMYGLITMPVVGWTAGTFLGVVASSIMPARLEAAMGIALYGMFIALIIPPAKKEKPVLMTVLLAIAMMLVLTFVPVFDFISDGFKVIITTIVVSALAAFLFPREDEADADISSEADVAADVSTLAETDGHAAAAEEKGGDQ